jgi:hypothetical protein
MEARLRDPAFHSGVLTALVSGIMINLRETALVEKEAYLELTAASCGINVLVLSDWRLVLRGLLLFGGWSKKALPPLPQQDGC